MKEIKKIAMSLTLIYALVIILPLTLKAQTVSEPDRPISVQCYRATMVTTFGIFTQNPWLMFGGGFWQAYYCG